MHRIFKLLAVLSLFLAVTLVVEIQMIQMKFLFRKKDNLRNQKKWKLLMNQKRR